MIACSGDEDSTPVRGIPCEPVNELLLVLMIGWRGDLAIAACWCCDVVTSQYDPTYDPILLRV